MVTMPSHTKWNARLYGEELVSQLAPQHGEHILDLGCGTGFLTHLISQSGAIVTGIDNSASMIGMAENMYPGLHFKLMSATDFHFDTPFDAIFSNAVLHYVLDKEAAIDCIYRNLKTGGRLVIEMAGKGNVEEIIVTTRKVLTRHGYYNNATTQAWYFPSLGEYTTLLEKKGFRIIYASHYDRPTELKDTENGIKDWIKKFGSAFFQHIPAAGLDKLLDEIQETVKATSFYNNKWHGNYKRLRIEAIRN